MNTQKPVREITRAYRIFLRLCSCVRFLGGTAPSNGKHDEGKYSQYLYQPSIEL